MSQTKTNSDFSWWQLIKALWYFLGVDRYRYLFWVSVLAAINFFQLVPTYIVGKLADFFTQYKTGDSLMTFYLYVFGLGIAIIITAFIRLSSKLKLGNIRAETVYRTRVEGFERLLDFSVKWHDQENTGNKVQRIQTGTTAISNFMNSLSRDTINYIIGVIGVVGVFVFLNPLFLIFLCCYLSGLYLIQVFFYRKIIELRRTANVFAEQASGVYYEGLANVLTIKTLGVKQSFKHNINQNELKSKQQIYAIQEKATTKWKVLNTFNALGLTCLLYLTGTGVINHSITIGSIFIYYSYFLRLFESANNIAESFDDLVEMKTGIERMLPIYSDTIETKSGTLPFPQGWHKISIVNGSFAYRTTDTDTSKQALHHLNFYINKYEKVGVVGRSGSGKSTLAKLMLGLYKLQQGMFTIGDINYYDIAHTQITHNIAIVLQESEMFNMSFAENITLMRKVNPQILTAAVEIAQLEDIIAKLPEGIDTLIGEKGYRLSGGERQRVGIARAICKDPQILILDEATSALDSKTEDLIQKALEARLQKKTVIIIAHRISTLQNVDRIYVFEHGTIIEEGTYRELSENPHSKFTEISQRQPQSD